MKTKASNGIEAVDLGSTAYTVFHKCQRAAWSPYERLAEVDQVPWQEVAVLAINKIDLPADEQATLEISARQLGQDLYAQFMAARGLEPEGLSMTEALAWEAVGRHLANIIDSDGSVDIAVCEERILDWMRDRTQLVC